MKSINLYNNETEFNKQNTFLTIPNVSLISDINKLIYNFEKIITLGGGVISPSVVNAIAL